MAQKTFLLMAGGTGGHIFPALAVAEVLREQGHRVVWLGSEGAMETRIVPQYGIELETIAVKAVRGKGLWRKLGLPLMLYRSINAACRVLQKHQVDAVIGFGGFVSFPGGAAAKRLGVPLVIHEQNAVAGLSNKMLARWADSVLYAFPKTFAHADGLVGNPVRADIEALPAPASRFQGREGHLKLLVTGGSLGAEVFNRLLPQALALLPAEQRPQVYHQSGRGKLDDLQQLYAQNGIDAECTEFIDNMAEAYAQADVVLCRAGALTIAELTTAGLGALLVPYPHAVDDHQTANARFMAADEAALLLPQTQLTAESLASVLSGLNRETCLKWAENARRIARKGSAQAVAETALVLSRKRS